MKPFRLVLFGLFLLPSVAFAQSASTTPTCSLLASPSTVLAGNSFTLKWTSTNATAGTVTGIGPVGPTGQANLVAPFTAQTVFTGTFTGTKGGTANCQVTIRVVHENESGMGGPGGNSVGGGSVSPGGGTGAGCTGQSCTGDNDTGATAPVTPVTSSTLPPPGSDTQNQTGGLVPCTGINCNLCAAGKLIQNIINFMIGISIPLAALLFAWAGVLYWTSGANPSNKDRAKHIFADAIIGFVIALAAFLIVQTILKVLLNTNYQNWTTIQCVSDSQRPGVGFRVDFNDLLKSVLPSLAPAPTPGGVTYNPGTGGFDPYNGGTLNPTTGAGNFSSSGCITGYSLSTNENGEYCQNNSNPDSYMDTGTKPLGSCGAGYKYTETESEFYCQSTTNPEDWKTAGEPPVGPVPGAKGSEQWWPQLQQACENNGLSDCTFARATMDRESSGNCSLPGPTKDYGCMQVTLSAARSLDPAGTRGMSDSELAYKLLNDPDYNMDLGVKELKYCTDKFGYGEMASACYNGGEKANRPSATCPGQTQWQCTANPGYQPTRNYAPAVVSSWRAYNR